MRSHFCKSRIPRSTQSRLLSTRATSLSSGFASASTVSHHHRHSSTRATKLSVSTGIAVQVGCLKRWRAGCHHFSNFLQITAIFSEFSVFQHSLRSPVMAQHFLPPIACDMVMTSIVVFAIISEQIQLQG